MYLRPFPVRWAASRPCSWGRQLSLSPPPQRPLQAARVATAEGARLSREAYAPARGGSVRIHSVACVTRPEQPPWSRAWRCILYRRDVQPRHGCMQAPGCLLQSGMPLFFGIDSEKGDQWRSISKSALNKTWHLQALHGAGASPMTHPSCQLVTWHHVWCPEAVDWSTSTSCCRYILHRAVTCSQRTQRCTSSQELNIRSNRSRRD